MPHSRAAQTQVIEFLFFFFSHLVSQRYVLECLRYKTAHCLFPPPAHQQGVSAAASPDPPATCLHITTPPSRALRPACLRQSSRMKTTTTTLIPPHSRHTQHTRTAPTASPPRPAAAAVPGRAQRSPEPSTPLPCRHGYCIQPLTTTTTSIISNMQHSSSKAPW